MKRVTFVSSCIVFAAAAALAQGCGSSGDSTFGDGDDGSSGSSGASTSGGFDPSREDGGGGSSSGDVDGGGDGGECATASAEAERIPVYMLLVVDGSGSMDGVNSNGNGYVPGERETDPHPAANNRLTGRKWLALRGALAAFVDDLAAKPDPNLAVGMYLFSSNTTKPANQTDVAISFVDAAHATAIKNRVMPPVFANGGTPLAASMNGQLPILKAYTPAAPVKPGGKYVLVVMTDGIPTDGKQACLTAASTALAGTPSVLTFAVGVGDENASATNVYDEVFVGDLAEAGGTAPAGCNTNWSDADKTGFPCHFQITPGTKTAQQIQADFLAAINEIRDTVSSCELALAFNSGDVDPTKVNVVYTSGAGQSSQIVQDATNGWTYDDPNAPTKVVLHGAACDALKSDPEGKVKIILGCKTVTGPGPTPDPK
ncbi:MAG: VWA domain-containing protein [Labilithrix sp.]|nr:VWA domain-containing protein [Labilithrix sp.]MCW5837929.1 VWA domain-containing protein [Labilithrix sp.]